VFLFPAPIGSPFQNLHSQLPNLGLGSTRGGDDEADGVLLRELRTQAGQHHFCASTPYARPHCEATRSLNLLRSSQSDIEQAHPNWMAPHH